MLWIPLVALGAALIPARDRVRSLTRRAPTTDARAAHAQRAEPCQHRAPSGRCLPDPPCESSLLPIDGLCVPARTEAMDDPSAGLESNAHTDRSGRLVVYEHIPRRPDLPADYDRYLYPTEPWGGQTVGSGYDLGRPDALQRRGVDLTAIGHGGVDLAQERGAPVRAIALRGQQGDAEVLYIGPLFGNTVVLSHVVREGPTTRVYLALHGHLDGFAPGLRKGQSVTPQTLLGFVGDSGAEGMVHLHYEIRLVRPGIDPSRIDRGNALVEQSNSVPCDPRNVLPMRTAPIRPANNG
ncbi:MAG: M23 family metallopeptidase [Polyangiales bacterium]